MLQHIKRKSADLVVLGPGVTDSPYRPRFNNGANIFPRLLFFIDIQDEGPLGYHAGHRRVNSSRSNFEKPPWKHLAALEGVVEGEFIRPTILRENVLPCRVLPPRDAVIPLERDHLLDGSDPRLDYCPGLAEWWRQAEAAWEAHRSSARLSLAQQLNFRRKLTAQLAAPPLRLVYSASGMHLAAAVVDDPHAILEHSLYWATVVSREEGSFLAAILNSTILTELVRPMMSYGKDEQHTDKSLGIFQSPYMTQKILSTSTLPHSAASTKTWLPAFIWMTTSPSSPPTCSLDAVRRPRVQQRAAATFSVRTNNKFVRSAAPAGKAL